MKIWITGSSLLSVAGIVLVVSQGCLALSGRATGADLNSMLVGAGIGISGTLLLVWALLGKLDLFPAGAPEDHQAAALKRRAVGYSATGAILIIFLLATGISAIAGAISTTSGVVVMWICFSGILAAIAMLGLTKREADRIGW